MSSKDNKHKGFGGHATHERERRNSVKYYVAATKHSHHTEKTSKHHNASFKYFTYEDGGNYRGECTSDGKRNGTGTYTYANGDVYSGTFVMGKRQGYGSYLHQVGGKYEGEWMNDSMHGRGKFEFHAGSVYEGAWFNNNQHGTGVLKEADGSYHVEHNHGKLTKKTKIVKAESNFWTDVMACTNCQP